MPWEWVGAGGSSSSKPLPAAAGASAGAGGGSGTWQRRALHTCAAPRPPTARLAELVFGEGGGGRQERHDLQLHPT